MQFYASVTLEDAAQAYLHDCEFEWRPFLWVGDADRGGRHLSPACIFHTDASSIFLAHAKEHEQSTHTVAQTAPTRKPKMAESPR